MKKTRLLLSAVFLFNALTGTAFATVLTFEGLTTSAAEGLTTNNQGYGGLIWDSTWSLYNDDSYPTPAQSGDYGIVNNIFQSPYGVSSAAPITFNGVWVSAWRFGETQDAPGEIKAVGYDAGNNVVGETSLLPLIISQRQYLQADFQNVSRVEFLAGPYFTLDDFTFDRLQETALVNPAVPEPMSLILFGCGVAGAVWRKRRAQHNCVNES